MDQNPKASSSVSKLSLWDSSVPAFRYIGLVAIAVIYFGAAKLGLSLAFIHVNVSPVWPPTGVAIAAVLLLGYRIWPAILVGAFLANLSTNVTVATASGIAIGNTLEAIAAGLLLRSWDFRCSLDRASDVFKFVLAAVVCPMASATIGNLSLCLSGAANWSDFGTLWLTWWLGDMVGALVIGPLLLVWSTKQLQKLSGWRYVEGAVLLALVSLASMATFVGPSPIPLKYYPIARLLVPFCLWIAFRFGLRGVTLASITVSVFAIWGTALGVGPFVGRTTNDSLLVLQLFLGSNVVMFLFLAATVEERRANADKLRESERRVAANLAITQILAESPAFGDATKRILQTIGESLDWKVGAMWTPGEKDNELRCLTLWHDQSTSVPRFQEVSRRLTFEPGVGLPGRVRTTLKPTWIPDVTLDNNFPRAPFADSEGLHSAFAFPILFGNKFLGVMEFFSDEIRQPDSALLAMFGSIGNQIGQFIERKRAEDEREQLLVSEHAARAEAELANRTKDEFLAIVSHELRTPLGAIVGWSGMLRSGTLDEKSSSRAIEVIDRNAKAQAQLIEDLLDVSRIVSGNLRIDPRPVRLQQVVEAAIDSIGPAAKLKDIRIQTNLDPRVGPVSGDPDRLQQVVWNLLSNAVKFTPSTGEINVGLASSDSQVEIVVGDSGQGIAEEFLPHVFDRFRQEDGSKTRRHGGLGLGLTIVRNLVELHGGNVKAHSEGDGKGTTITISLPRLIIENDETRQQKIQENLLSLAKHPELVGLRILAVDDDSDSRDMIEMILNSYGADVVSVGTVREALDVMKRKEWKPELLLSDLGMPNEDGYDLIRNVRSTEEHGEDALPAIAITGYAENQESERALDAGFHAHLTKPVDWNELVKTIITYVGKRQTEVGTGSG
jgi:signal transduction histidine kinase/integral membrane sensor domain MASE1/CheY-like chemotaxis protein